MAKNAYEAEADILVATFIPGLDHSTEMHFQTAIWNELDLITRHSNSFSAFKTTYMHLTSKQ